MVIRSRRVQSCGRQGWVGAFATSSWSGFQIEDRMRQQLSAHEFCQRSLVRQVSALLPHLRALEERAVREQVSAGGHTAGPVGASRTVVPALEPLGKQSSWMASAQPAAQAVGGCRRRRARSGPPIVLAQGEGLELGLAAEALLLPLQPQDSSEHGVDHVADEGSEEELWAYVRHMQAYARRVQLR
uniref:Uncharacterized protein n=1 Tax=Alexandrium monilatum TaxID=311494 RepID=A0A7S4PTS6_9DINO